MRLLRVSVRRKIGRKCRQIVGNLKRAQISVLIRSAGGDSTHSAPTASAAAGVDYVDRE